MTSLETAPQEKAGPVPKRNRMTHRPHSVKVEAKIVDGIQDLGQNLIGSIKVPQISPRIPLADPAAAIGVQRALISGVSRLLDGHFAFRRKQQARAAPPAWAARSPSCQRPGRHTRRSPPACPHPSDNAACRPEDAAKWLRQLHESRAGFAHTQPADRIARKPDFDGALGRFLSELQHPCRPAQCRTEPESPRTT